MTLKKLWLIVCIFRILLPLIFWQIYPMTMVHLFLRQVPNSTLGIFLYSQIFLLIPAQSVFSRESENIIQILDPVN